MSGLAQPISTEAALTHAATSLTTAAEAITRLGSAKERAQRSPLPRRGLNRVEAAEYVGISPTTFDGLVTAKKMPSPVRVGSRTIWDIRTLDLAFEALAAPSDENPWDNWG